MLPTLDQKDNLVLLDCFTTRFVRDPKVGEVIISENPIKPGCSITKRVVQTEGKMVEFWSHRDQQNVQLLVPEGHIWIEGDNKDNSKDCRDFGPLPLTLVDGIVRYRVWPLEKICKL